MSTPLYFTLRTPSKRKTVRVHCLKRRRRLTREARGKGMVGEKRIMEIKNLNLYKENQSIMRENERLRKKALLLQKENQELLSQIQKKVLCSSDTLSSQQQQHLTRANY